MLMLAFSSIQPQRDIGLSLCLKSLHIYCVLHYIYCLTFYLLFECPKCVFECVHNCEQSCENEKLCVL